MMVPVTVAVPPEFEATVNEMVAKSQAGSFDGLVNNLVREAVFGYQIQAAMVTKQQALFLDFNSRWPGPGPQFPPAQ